MQVGIIGIAVIVMATLKLSGSLDWSWGWILAPLLIPVLVWVVFTAMYFKGATGRRKAKGQRGGGAGREA